MARKTFISYKYSLRISHNSVRPTPLCTRLTLNDRNAPFGLTGFVAEDLWKKVMEDTNAYYPNNKDLIETIKSLGAKNSSDYSVIKI